MASVRFLPPSHLEASSTLYFVRIGTDATIAQHIQTIVDRGYVLERMEGSTKYLVPSTLGIGLVEGYNEIGFDRSLSKPQLRREVRLSTSCTTQYPLLTLYIRCDELFRVDGAQHGGSLRTDEN